MPPISNSDPNACTQAHSSLQSPASCSASSSATPITSLSGIDYALIFLASSRAHTDYSAEVVELEDSDDSVDLGYLDGLGP